MRYVLLMLLSLCAATATAQTTLKIAAPRTR